ncbi:hypothetical protein BDZ94DRAFT_1251673 [Collybia nuda]|uniref:Uncharacterized protein n=1 Tax=Collybia nuda TaxID=64659 RepID=A0A9P6CN41_9AGAR|nr:hypothetical protein BDZ94DRAFT_1251673 [Collybia nuda]
MSEPTNLFSLARTKLHLSVGGKDSVSLHRWVLLKNSIIHSPSCASSTFPDINPSHPSEDGEDDEADEVSEEVDSFMFPDAGKLVGGRTADVNASEADWLDSLLERLGDDDDDDFPADSDSSVSIIPVDDDEDALLLSPLGSPMSSSDDLPAVTYPYPVPYPPFHPPLIHSYAFNSSFDSSLASLSAPYDDPLPYYDLDDSENLSVPDAIEDTSDDESDVPLTPSIGNSSTSLNLVDAASIPLPPERSRLRHTVPHIYFDADESYFNPFELDPLPFPEPLHRNYNTYQEC